MIKNPDISQVDPDDWTFYVSVTGYYAGYSNFAIRVLQKIILTPSLFAEVTKKLTRFQIWYYANRDRRIAYDRKYYAEHRQGRREAAKRRREKQRKENCK